MKDRRSQAGDQGCNGMSRRTLLESFAGMGAMLCLGPAAVGLHPSVAEQNKLIRPPGGQLESRFVALCVKCNRCEEVCPTNVVSIAHLRDGLLAARTPKLDFSLGYCNFCMKCIEVCPTHALQRVEKSKARIGVAVVLKDQCIPWQWGGCTLCYEKCPVKAIRLDEQKRPVIDTAKCNGCGLCKKICPATELRSYQPGQTRGIEIESIRS
jgi:ferredoxin-type protein NapG